MSAEQGPETRLARWRSAAGLDFHVLVTLMYRGWAIVAGAATVFLLPLSLSPLEQGYYYTFGSVLALQIFFELGLNQIVIQLVSHEVAHLRTTSDGRFEGNASHLDRLSSLARLINRWYLVAAILFAVVGGIAGAIFFDHKGTLPAALWAGAWLTLVAATAANLWLSPNLAVIEGCGNVGQVARLRLIQSAIGYAALWAALWAGAGLWATTVIPVVCVLCTGLWLRPNGRILRWLKQYPTDKANRLDWVRDVLPLQWRIAVSWMSGYFIFNLFTPLVFSHQGAIAAGQLGMALTIFTAVSTIGMSWITAKSPYFTMHISRTERKPLNTLFMAVLARSCAATAGLSFFVVIGAWALVAMDLQAMSRIAPPTVLTCLGWVAVVNSVIFGAATYMRAHREEPMLPASVVTGLLTATAAWFGSRQGVTSMMLMYAMITTFITLPWTLILFARYFKRTA